jgi:hypothetical protein
MKTGSHPPARVRLIVAVLGVLGLSLTATSSVHGAAQITQIGQLAPPGATLVSCQSDLNAIQTRVGSESSYQLPSAGVITSWQVRGFTSSPATASLGVWNRVLGNTFQLVGKSDPEAFDAGKNNFKTGISAGAGDFLGIHTNAEIDGCAFNRGKGNIPLGVFGPNPSIGDTLDFERTDSARLNISATLEPDADCDGLGDVSQDQVVSGKCLPPSVATLVSRKVRMRRGKVLLKVSCSLHGGDCRDNTLKLRSIRKVKVTANGPPKRLVVGKASFSLVAGSTSRIRVRISPKAKLALNTISPLKSRATIKAKSPIAQPKLSQRNLKIRR